MAAEKYMACGSAILHNYKKNNKIPYSVYNLVYYYMHTFLQIDDKIYKTAETNSLSQYLF